MISECHSENQLAAQADWAGRAGYARSMSRLSTLSVRFQGLNKKGINGRRNTRQVLPELKCATGGETLINGPHLGRAGKTQWNQEGAGRPCSSDRQLVDYSVDFPPFMTIFCFRFTIHTTERSLDSLPLSFIIALSVSLLLHPPTLLGI